MIEIKFEIRSGAAVRQTIDFTGGAYKLLDGYSPETADGQTLTESFFAWVTGASAVDLVEKVRAVELALDFARAHKDGPDGVWMLFSPDDGLDPWQARLSGGAVLHDGKMGSRWREAKARVEVVVERSAFWETTAAVTVSGPAPVAVSGPGAGMVVTVPAVGVIGALPCPAVIEFENTTNDAALVDTLLVGHFAASAPTDPPDPAHLVLEGAGAADAACSGGSYAALAWADAAETQLTTWTIASADFQQRDYKFAARFRDVFVYTDLWLKCKLLAGSTVIAETRWELMSPSRALQTIGTIPIPPFRHGVYVDLGNLTVALYSKRAAGAGSINLDYLALLPQDSWRRYRAITGLAYGETLIDDPVRSLCVSQSGAAYKVTHQIEEGEPVMLQPGVDNVLYVLHDCADGAAPVERTAAVTVKCHPRRRTV
jgi:hypothetical protein